MTGHFPHYPASPDEIVGLAAELLNGSGRGSQLIGDVNQQNAITEQATDGILTDPVHSAPHLVVSLGADFVESARFAAGALTYWAQAIMTYNAGIDRLNSIWSSIQPPPTSEQVLGAFEHSRQQLDDTLDTAGLKTASMLNAGPNAADVAFLSKAGALPPYDVFDDPNLTSALAKAGAGCLSPDAKVDPAVAAAWWASLTVAERRAIITAYPARVGGAQGLPAEARDDANRINLTKDIELYAQLEANGMITDDQRKILDNARAVWGQIQNIESQRDPITNESLPAQLLIYEPGAYGGQGRGAVSVGNMDSAQNVAYTVPGMGTELSSVNTYVPRSLNLYGETRRADPGATTAVLSWIGYDAPSGDLGQLKVVGHGMAEEGGRLLASDVAAFQASRLDDPAHLTVIGHSYGSTTTAYAATDDGMRPDDIVLVGSPGAAGADDAGDLGIGADHVFVGAASRDIVSMLGNHGWVNAGSLAQGNDPAEDDFGAVRFRAEKHGSHIMAPWGRRSQPLLGSRLGIALQHGQRGGRLLRRDHDGRLPLRPVVGSAAGSGVGPYPRAHATLSRWSCGEAGVPPWQRRQRFSAWWRPAAAPGSRSRRPAAWTRPLTPPRRQPLEAS